VKIEMKEIKLKEGRIYGWTCPYCGKNILSATPKQLKFNVRQHLLFCKRRPREGGGG
jgi:hypothetical protein